MQGILGLALFAAIGAGGVTALVTGSFVLAALCYVGAGMAVLIALLVSEMLFPPLDNDLAGDDPALVSDPRA